MPGPGALVAMFAVWRAGGVYVPVNRRATAQEVSEFLAETPLALVIGAPADLDAHELAVGTVAYDHPAAQSAVRARARADAPRYEPDVAFVLRTSGTTGRPKAVLIRHSGTIDALDASLVKLREAAGPAGQLPAQSDPGVAGLVGRGLHRVVQLPGRVRRGAARVLHHRGFRASREGARDHLDDPGAGDDHYAHRRRVDFRPASAAPGPVITAPLLPQVAREFYRRYGIFVLNSYGQTELGGEVVGWSAEDVRAFGEAKLGAAGRPYVHVDLRIRREDGSDADPGELGEIIVNSPYRMRGYASADGTVHDDSDNERFVDGYLRTGDLGRLDADGFLWIEGRVSDMINRGGIKVFPDEVEEVLRQFPAIRDVGVCARPDRRLGEVPHAWYVAAGEIEPAELAAWCRRHLAPYKVPVGFTRVGSLPRSDIGKLLRRELTARLGGPPVSPAPGTDRPGE